MDEARFDINQAVVLKNDNLFLVANPDASIPVAGQHPFGLYYDDCRFLSGWELTVLGHEPRSLACSAADGRSATHELTNSEFTVDHGRAVPAQAMQVRVERELSDGRTLEERITLTSFAPEPLEGELVLRMRSGFEPLMWLRGLVPQFKPKRPTVTAGDRGLTVAVTGRDGVERRLMTACRPAPDAVRGQTLRWRVTLRRGHPQTIALRHVAADGARVRVPKPPAARPRRTAQQAAAARATRVTTDDELAGRILEQSFADLQMLRSQLGRESYYAAGIPWYATVFGRDTLLASIQMLAYDPQIAEQTLRLLARNLGSQVNAATEEEPGKVLHELRVGELANLGLLPFARYYGSVDSTPLFLCLLAEHADWSGDLELFHELADAVDAALEWIDRWGDRDGDGLLEYERGTPEGLLNQGWKDSPDGVPDARGNALQTPIALIEPQAYVVSAKRRLARLFARAGDGERAERLRRESTELQERIERFWLDREGFYSLALDGRKRPSRALASNQGHLLWSVAVAPERAAAVRDALMRPELFCGWGVRTLAASEPSFNPVGYHTGSVWPHDSALIAAGLRKYGYDDDFAAIFEGLLEAASQFPDYRLPELFGGFSRTEQAIPVPYPVACRPQAWAAGSIPYLLRVGLGLDPCGLERKLRIIRPSLPRWLNRLELKGLRMAESAIDLTFERNDGVVALADVQIEGDADVELVR